VVVAVEEARELADADDVEIFDGLIGSAVATGFEGGDVCSNSTASNSTLPVARTR
jgi:hypothetical protein